MSNACGCGQPVDGAYLCQRCCNRMRRDLLAVDDICDELDTVLARNTAYNEHHGGRSADTPLPIDTRASEAAWVLRNTLTTWARILHDERGVPLPTASHTRHSAATTDRPWGEWTTERIPTAQIASWLADQTSELRQLPAAYEAHDDITAAVRNAQRTIDTPPNRTTIPVGPCPEPHCTGTVRAYIPHDTPAHMTCNGEQRHRWEPHQWTRAGQRILRARQEVAT